MTADVLKGLKDRQIESHVTPTSLKGQISDALKEFGLDKIVASLQSAGAAATAAGPQQAVVAPALVTYC